MQKSAHDFSDEFDEFWAIYPRKESRIDGLKAYEAARKTTDAKTILAGVQVYALANIGVEKQFVKLAGGWLRGQRWADEPVVRDAAPVPEERTWQPAMQLSAPRPPTTAEFAARMCSEPGHEAYPRELSGPFKGKCTQCARTADLAAGVSF